MTSDRARALRSGGMTLVEMLISLGLVSVLLTATGSALLLAARALPDRLPGPGRIARASAALESLNAELTFAVGVSEMSSSAITFTIPDRTGDGTPEIIRYAWDTKPGGTLTRSINGSEPAVVLDDVHDFSLVYDRRRQALPTTYTVGPESLLFQHTGGSTLTDFAVDSSNWIAQPFRPTLSSDVAWWTVTRVLVRARVRDEAAGDTRVQLRDMEALGMPGATILDQAALVESSLPAAYEWREVRLNRAVQLQPGTTVCVVMRWLKDTHSCEVQVRGSYNPGGAIRTIDGGGTWAPMLGHIMLMQVYGVTATANPARYVYLLNDVRVSLQAGAAASGRVGGMIVPVNLPEVPPP